MAPPPLVATYRLQLTPSFGLDQAAAIVPYLHELGISHVYTSSYLQAASGSTHGYDTVDHSKVNTELGGEPALQRFHAALREHGLGNVVDVVPNHVSVADAAANSRWWRVLRDGPDGPDAAFFDIDWDPPEDELHGIVLLPVLGADYWHEVRSGELQVAATAEGHEVRYHGMRFPVAPGTGPATDTAVIGLDVHPILERQHYRLAHWRIGRDMLNYRRFFDVTSLAGVRVEDPCVFRAVHERTLGWVRSGDVQGLRVDHPDGLRDPTAYLIELRRAAPDAWIVVEKILEPGEELPASWPVDGTTGYDVMRRITGVFVDSAAEASLTATFREFTGIESPYADLVRAAKLQVLHELLGTEVTRLTDLAVRSCTASDVARDFSRREVRAALEAVLAAMPVYRTYASNAAEGPNPRDRAVVAAAVDEAASHSPGVDPLLFEVLTPILDGTIAGADATELAVRFEQLSGPAMAKGVEDTVFYRYMPLLALNEVGSDPSHFGVTIEEFHRESIATSTNHPRTMSATSTHDTKRSEDVRARIALLSEMPGEWRDIVLRWRAMNDAKWAGATPNRPMEHLLYQTLVGAHPLSPERARDVLVKSMREAKLVTSWFEPTSAEDEMLAFADAIAADPLFQTELDALTHRLAPAARIASLNQLVLKVLGPGIPDFYQGNELLRTGLVDPDNRAEVDFEESRRQLQRCDDPTARCADASLAKLDLTRRLLHLRAARHEAFSGSSATYAPIEVVGDDADRALAFARGSDVVAIVGVRPLHIADHGWGRTSVELPAGRWRDALSDDDESVVSGRIDLDTMDAGRPPTGHLVLIRADS